LITCMAEVSSQRKTDRLELLPPYSSREPREITLAQDAPPTTPRQLRVAYGGAFGSSRPSGALWYPLRLNPESGGET